MDMNLQKEELSRAYIFAVAAMAGFAVEHVRVDNDGVDLRVTAARRDGYKRAPRLEIQAKATSRDVLRPNGVHYPLKAKYYDDLRGERDTALILVVLVMPPALQDWGAVDDRELVLRRCAFWASLVGRPPLGRDATGRTVVIPRGQVFDPASLRRIMRNLSMRKRP